MTDQASLMGAMSDARLSELEKNRGMARGLSAHSAEQWGAAARYWVESLDPGRRITADDIARVIGLPTEHDLFTVSNNAVGGLIHGLAAAGVLKPAGFVPSIRVGTRGRVLRVWERC